MRLGDGVAQQQDVPKIGGKKIGNFKSNFLSRTNADDDIQSNKPYAFETSYVYARIKQIKANAGTANPASLHFFQKWPFETKNKKHDLMFYMVRLFVIIDWREHIGIQKLLFISLPFDATHYFAPSNLISNCCMNIDFLSNQQ